MNKYKPLEIHLSGSRRERESMTFKEIEALIKAKLPASARKHRSWWSNNPRSGVITKSWLKAGYKSANVDMKDETIDFVKLLGDEPMHLPDYVAVPDLRLDPVSAAQLAERKVLAKLKGAITVMPGVDLTAPTSGNWGVSED